MAWPTSTDYNEAIQNPQVCFADADLRAGQADGLMGLPQPYSGNFADVYKLLGANGKNWAVKCFTREVKGLHDRYQAISEHLREEGRSFIVDFQYLEDGIKVKGEWFPILKMSWVEGFTLNEFMADHAREPAVLDRLAELWVKLAAHMREARMAHGDLQHGNVLLVPGSKANALALRLVDYDGMCVPALADQSSGELGHRNYQHPGRVDGDGYGPQMDHFSQLVIAVALRGLGTASGLWSKYGDPENMLFRHQDFVEPATSPLLKELWQLPDAQTRALTGRLVLACAGPLAEVPWLCTLIDQGEARLLTNEEEDRVETLLFAEPTNGRKTRLLPRRSQSAPMTMLMEAVEVPLLPATLHTEGSRAALLPVPVAPDVFAELKAVPLPPPLPKPAAEPRFEIPPVPVLTVVPLEATTDAVDGSSLSASAAAAVLLGRMAQPIVVPAQPRRKSHGGWQELRTFVDARPGMAWGALGAAGALVFCLIFWGLWPGHKSATPLSPEARARIVSIPSQVVYRGEEVETEATIDRGETSEPLLLVVDGLPPGVRYEPVELAPGESKVRLAFYALPNAELRVSRLTVSLVSRVGRVVHDRFDKVWLTIDKRPPPHFVSAPQLTLLVGESREEDFQVDAEGNKAKLSVIVDNLPRGVTCVELPASKPDVLRVVFHVDPTVLPIDHQEVTVRLKVGDAAADERRLLLSIQKRSP